MCVCERERPSQCSCLVFDFIWVFLDSFPSLSLTSDFGIIRKYSVKIPPSLSLSLSLSLSPFRTSFLSTIERKKAQLYSSAELIFPCLSRPTPPPFTASTPPQGRAFFSIALSLSQHSLPLSYLLSLSHCRPLSLCLTHSRSVFLL